MDESTNYVLTDVVLNKSIRFNVLDSTTWPTRSELQLNENQFEAYETGLLCEFALIQGPPGTGKTYLGLKIAKTILDNLSVQGCKLLVVCYTNHVLDQFLEGISKVTDSIVRIGGQSKNEAMTKFNLNSIRKNKQSASHRFYGLYQEERRNIKNCMLQIRRAQEEIDSFSYCILSFYYVQEYFPQITKIAQYYSGVIQDGDPLCHWLFEHLEYDIDESIPLQPLDNEIFESSLHIGEENERNNVLIDNFNLDFDENNAENSKAYSTKRAQRILNHLIVRFNCSRSAQEKRDLRKDIAILRAQIRLFNVSI